MIQVHSSIVNARQQGRPQQGQQQQEQQQVGDGDG